MYSALKRTYSGLRSLKEDLGLAASGQLVLDLAAAHELGRRGLHDVAHGDELS